MIEFKLNQRRSGPHRLEVGNLVIYFSYETPVAVYLRNSGVPMMVRQNDWGTTTGKHLNEIDGGSKEAKKERVSEERFESYYEGLLQEAGLL